MAETGLKTFDSSLQLTHWWLNDLMEKLGWTGLGRSPARRSRIAGGSANAARPTDGRRDDASGRTGRETNVARGNQQPLGAVSAV